ncbi:MAG: alpha-2-macroglobulin family protein [Devosia sp.]
MKNLRQAFVLLCATLWLALGATVLMAADRSVTPLPETDLPGFDYSTIKDTTARACSAACLEEGICRAFTFNEKAKWCFLKSEAGTPTPFDRATSGTITIEPAPSVLASQREGELPFPAADLISNAQYFGSQLPTTDAPPKDVPYADLVAAGDDAVAQENAAAALVSYRQALALNDNDPALWFKLAEQLVLRADSERELGNGTYELSANATYAAVNGFLLSENLEDRAEGLAWLAQGLERREMWRESIATYRASIALVDAAELQARLDTVVAEHGFRITSNEVDAEAAAPRICIVFSDPLPLVGTDLSSYVVVEGASGVAVETEQSQICLTGVEHGRRYPIKVRAGLPSADGEELRKDVELDVYVPDRTPFVAFANNAYVMPAGLGGGLPITSVNAATTEVQIYRIGDRSIATAIRNGIFQRSLDGYSAEDVAYRYGELSWEGEVDLGKAGPNEMTTTAIPVADVLGDIQPGAYVVTAKVKGLNQEYWRELATQWFIVTDLGLTTVSGEDGIHAFVRSLTSAEPVGGSKVRLIAMNNEILGETRTDANGRADFAPGLGRGEGGRAPQLLVAETDGGDYSFLDISKPAFDLTDRGVEGRPTPGPLDLFATTERGVYRPNETVFLTALLRDTHAKAVSGLPLTFEIERPDGVVASSEVLSDQGAGGYFKALTLVDDAMRGSWTARFYADPKAAALSSITFLVEDFEPERLAFEVSAPDQPIVAGEVTAVSVMAKYLYGATAPGLAIEADAVIKPVNSLPAYPGYVFGRLDDSIQADRIPLGLVGTTGEDGNATAEVTLPETQATTRPLEAQLIMRLVDTNGRTVERSLSRPVLADVDRIGLKPQFDEYDGIEEGTSAGFDVITVAPTGEPVAKTGLNWTLSRIETNYQWYRDNGVWKWEAITTTREAGNGTIDTVATGPLTISAPVQWGRYVLEIESTGDSPTSTSIEFYAGYYYPEVGSDTPDTLQVALDKPAYRVGDTATLKLDPQFAGTALVMVVDDRIIDMKAVEVPAEGASVALTVTDDWGPGAYVTAILYRPASVEEKRMPARALGLAFADVEPGDLKLDVVLDTPEEALPRQPFTAAIKLANAKPGDQAYVAVAAVDLGILNLTRFQVPDPDGWFFGQRQLGTEFRDLYGQLIDTTQGLPGVLRSGGDEGNSRLGSAPPTSVLVALHSGIVKVGEDGTASVSFDMPDFAGTVRVMAMAWSANAVGHASKDVVVRDPVVVTMTPPRFLRLDDTSRLLVEINNVGGPAGAYKVELITGTGLSTDAAVQSVDLAAAGRTSLDLKLVGTAIGDNDLKLIVTDPAGRAYVKDLTLGVRAAAAPETTSKLIPLGPGESVSLDATYFAGMVPHTGAMTLAIGPIARLDVPGLLYALDRYPYGCAEQITSRAMPLLYLNEVAQMIEMGSDDALAERIRDAIANLLSKQNSSGGFGLWGPFSSSDMWLDSYVTDFLLRAKAEGYDVPEQAMTRALDNLSNQVSYAADFSNGGEDVAYALYDLSRAGRAAIGDLRYYLEARLDAFGSPLAKAQLGAALALYGDRSRAATAFAAAVEGLNISEDRYRYRADYGSLLRDSAGVLALAAEFAPSGVDVAALTTRLADLRGKDRWHSTQEDAWTLLAASTIGRQSTSGKVTIDGVALEGSVYRRYDQEAFDNGPVTVTNSGNQKTEMQVTVTAIPAVPPAARSEGFTITRDYYLPDGTRVDDLSQVSQNQRFVVVLTVDPGQFGSGQYVLADHLPAGFEIENPDLSAGGVADLGWLSVSTPTHVEARTEQYVAAFTFGSEPEMFSTAYMVRAVSPGTFVHPGTTIEDMYRPELRANLGTAKIEVAATGR